MLYILCAVQNDSSSLILGQASQKAKHQGNKAVFNACLQGIEIICHSDL